MPQVARETPGPKGAEELRAELDALYAEAEIAQDFVTLTNSSCSRHGLRFEKECDICRYVKAWATFRAFWERQAEDVHNRFRLIKNIHTAENQEIYIRFSEAEELYQAWFKKPEAVASKGNRGWIARKLLQVQMMYERAVERRNERKS